NDASNGGNRENKFSIWFSIRIIFIDWTFLLKIGGKLHMHMKLMETMGIETISMEKDKVVLSMPVDERTHQPAGLLHGGASVLLAETAAIIAGVHNIDQENQSVFGIEINASHIKSKKDGRVVASATPYHVGKRPMVWDIEITDEKKQLVCISRCTLGVVDKRGLNGWCYNDVYYELSCS